MDNNKNQNMINFRQRKSKLLRKKIEAEKLLDVAIENYNNISKSHSLRKEIKLNNAQNIIYLREKNLNVINTELEYLRPRNEEDMLYRQRQYNEFSDYITQNIPDDLPLRFHGTSIYATKEIIASGEISSPGDRFGVEASYDSPGQIYVNTKDNIFNSVRNFCNLTYDYDLPAGCLFVVTPKDSQDEKTGHNQIMESVYFRNNPDRLVAVISTPENINNIRSWLRESGLPSDKAFTYDGFIKSIEKVKNSVVLPYKNSQKETFNEKKSFSSLESMISNAESRASKNKNVMSHTKEIINYKGGRDK